MNSKGIDANIDAIYDYYDDFTLGKANYGFWLTSPLENTRPGHPGRPYGVDSIKGYSKNTDIRFIWEEASDDVGVVGYNVYISSDNVPYGSANFVVYNSFNLNGKNEHKYRIRVAALDSVGYGQKSLESDNITVDTFPPSPVISLSAVSQPYGSIKLNWSVATDTASGVAYYNVYRSINSGELGAKVSIDGLVTTEEYTDCDVNMLHGVLYYYTVGPVDTAGNEQTQGNIQISAICNKAASENDIYVYPNPFKPTSNPEHTGITFGNLGLNSTIRIYTLSGKLVWKKRE